MPPIIFRMDLPPRRVDTDKKFTTPKKNGKVNDKSKSSVEGQLNSK